jgi:alpha-ketoglutarate-dependent 2,4-dichlorophenoxyacetate dioxygenase
LLAQPAAGLAACLATSVVFIDAPQGGERARGPWVVGPRVSPAGGVRMEGADLSQPLAPELKEAIRAAFLEHHIVVFPGQKLTREEQFAFARNFGEIEAHRARGAEGKRYAVAHVISNLDAEGKPVARFSAAANHHWHTDKPYQPTPPMLTMLYAVELPPRGGETEFANTALAYDALRQETKRRIARLRVLFAPAFEPESRRSVVDHPLVRTHPDTGRKALYLGNHAIGILGMAEATDAVLLDALLEHATARQFVYTHRWQRGDLLMWDNRCLLHRALANYDMRTYRRVLHRSVVRGTVPF